MKQISTTLHNPMFGRKIKIFHKGILMQCHRCYENHSVRTCRNRKVSWIDYVHDFVQNSEGFEKQMFGKWWGLRALKRSIVNYKCY